MAQPSTLIARDGDTLDALLWREAALGPQALGPVLAANPGLGGMGAILAAGAIVIVPATTPTTTALPFINLWD